MSAGSGTIPALIRENGINPKLGLCDAYTHIAPMVDTDVYMRWLLGEVRQARLPHRRAQDNRLRLRAQASRPASLKSTPSSIAPGWGPGS